MASLGGARLGLCVLRSEPLAGASLFCCHRQSSKLNTLLISKGVVHKICSRRRSAIAGQKQRELWDFDLMDFKNELNIADKSRQFRRFITDPGLARTVYKCIKPTKPRAHEPIIMEFNPGPGIVTRTLLDAGSRVVVLECQTDYLPYLQRLQNNTDGQLDVVHCDFFRLDPLGYGSMLPPAMYSDTLFENLGISKVPWTADVPVKVFGVFSKKNESNFFWKNIYSIYEGRSIYRYGRLELNMFISEMQYKKLTSKPGDMSNYKSLTALYQTACDIELLHMEPWSSFFIPSKFRGLSIPKCASLPNEHMCLVRFTPRRNLFTQTLTPDSGRTFVIMLRQFLARRKAKLIDRLNSFDPGNAYDIMKAIGLPENIETGNVHPEQYKLLFEAIQTSESFNNNWISEASENIHCLAY
ncbi:dimethyladenosine transferase 2, mitochondrial [Pelodytes ibericus]